MALTVDTITATAVGQDYVIKADHRDGTHDKAQWKISMDEEVDTFERGFGSEWFSSKKSWAWSLYLNTQRPNPLGVSKRSEPPIQRLWIAKFVKNASPAFWHGYPADYRRRTQDRPDIDVLEDWRRQGFIGKREIAKIRSGLKCNLSK